MSVKPCNIRIPSGLSDAQVAADAACAAKRYAYSAEQVESRLNSYVDDLTGLDLEQIAANTAAAAEVVERTEAAAATAQYSAEIVERLAPEVKDMLDTIVEQDLEQLRQDIEVATNLIATVDGKVSDAQQAATDARGYALQADQSETAAEAALAETWTAYSAILSEKDSAAAHFAEEAEEKVAEAVTAQLNPGGDFYAALNTAVHDTIPNTVKNNADEYVTELTTEGGSLYNYVEASKAEISSLQGGAVSTIITHREAALTAITTAEDEAIESIGNKVDAYVEEKIDPEYISEKVNAVLPGLIDAELADENGAWNTAKNEAIADATEQAELARQWATSDTHVAGTSYSGAYGYMLMAERYADQTESDAGRAAESASLASSSAAAAEASRETAASSASAAANSELNAAASASAAVNSEVNAEAAWTAASNSASEAKSYSISASNSALNAMNYRNSAARYMEAAEAFAVSEYYAGFTINNTPDGPEVVPAASAQSYSSAKTYADLAYNWATGFADTSARSYADQAHGYANQAYSYVQVASDWAERDTIFTAYDSDYHSYSAASARMWAENERVFDYSIKGSSGYVTVPAASARMWAEAEESFYLNGEEHKSAKAYAELAETSETNAASSASAASDSASAAKSYSINASSSASASDRSANLSARYAEVAKAFAVSKYESGFGIIDNGDGPEIVPGYSDISQNYSSAKTYAEWAAFSAEMSYSWATGDGSRSARVYANKAESWAETAYSWAEFDEIFTYSTDEYSQPRQVASARMWAEAEESFSLNDEVHKSAKAWAKLAETDEAEALLHAQQANAAAADAAIAYEGTLNAYEGTLNAYEATKAAVGEAETYLTDVNAVKNTIDQTLISSNWTANNIPVDDSGAFTVTPGLVYAVWSKEVCEVYKDAALENKLCTIWAEEQRCILATQATYYVSPVEQAASVIITSVQYTQPSA